MNHAIRPVEAGRLAAGVDAFVASGAPGAVVVVDLDRVHLVDGDEVRLNRAIEAVGTVLTGRAAWLRVDRDVVVALATGIGSRDATAELVGELLGEVDRAFAVERDMGAAARTVASACAARPSIGAAWRARPDRDQARHAAAVLAAARRGVDRVAVVDASDASALSAGEVDAGAAALASVAAREPLDDFLVRTSTAAMSQSPARFLARLDATLGELGRLLGVDYVFVDVMGTADSTVSNFAGWCSAEHRGFIRTEPRYIAPDDPWHDVLHRLEPVVIDDQFTSHAGHHPGNHPSGGVAQAFVTVPFVVSNRLAGALGVGTIARPRLWTEDEVTTVRLATGVIAGVIERNRVEIEHRSGAR